MHGAGVIEGIEEKEVLGEKKRYYIMRLPIGEMRVMIPTDNVADAGLRFVIDREGIERVIDILGQKGSEMSSNWNHRYRANMEKIKSGDVFEVAEVVRNLALREREKGLSTGERKMFDSAKQILISELALAQGTTREQVEASLEEILG